MSEHVKPFVYETLNTKALHFSLSEIQSRMQVQRPDALDLDYTRTMMGVLLFNSQPRTLAMIGLGGGSLAKFCHRHLPKTRIKVVEINPHVIALRDEFRVPRDDGRFEVRLGDGADFMRLPPHPFEVLMVDGFDSSGQPPALCSAQFYDDCYDALDPNGLMVVNLHADPRSHATYVGRIQRAFDEEVIVVHDADHSNSIVFACKGPLMRQFNSPLLRKPRHFDPAAWDDLLPAFNAVDRALAQWRSAD